MRPTTIALWRPVVGALGLAGMLTLGIHQASLFAGIAESTVTVRRGGDFAVFYRSAQLAVQGDNPYDQIALERTPERIRTPNLNPPHATLLFAPLTFVAPLTALTIWLVASVLSALLVCRLVFRELHIRATPRTIALTAFILLCAAPTGAFLLFFQVSWLLWAPVTASWALARNGRWNAAAAVLGVAISIKPFLGLFVPFFLLRRQWRVALIASSTAGLCFAAGLLALGWNTFASWLRAIASVTWAAHIFNASVMGFSDRLFNQRDIAYVWALAPFARWPLVAAGLSLLGIVIVSVGSWFALRLHGVKNEWSNDPTVTVDRIFAITLFAALLITPLGWIYYYCLPAAPMIALLRNPQWRASIRWRKGFLVVGVVSMALSPGTVLIGQPAPWATASIGSAYFWGALSLWICTLTPIRGYPTNRLGVGELDRREYENRRDKRGSIFH